MIYAKQEIMKIRTISIITSVAMMLASCGNNTGSSDTKQKPSNTAGTLIGAGATFPYPLYSKMFSVYHQQKNMKVNYQSVGSGAGIQQLQNRIVDFGASDAPMSDEELKSAPAAIVHIPTTLGAVVITYNLPDNPTLKFTPEVLSGLFMGKIKNWRDPAIAQLNPDVKLPSLPVSFVHRSDGSGTTFILSDYLAKVSRDWATTVGKGKSLNWPTGLGAKGNEGVSGFVKQTPGSIGYVELAYAFQNKMPMATLQNMSGNFVAPTLAATSAAANIGGMPDDLRVSITNTPASDGYPICSFSYIIVYREQSYNNRSLTQAKNTVDLIDWMLHDGQQFSEELQYGQLPQSVVDKATYLLKTVTFKNEDLKK